MLEGIGIFFFFLNDLLDHREVLDPNIVQPPFVCMIWQGSYQPPSRTDIGSCIHDPLGGCLPISSCSGTALAAKSQAECSLMTQC